MTSLQEKKLKDHFKNSLHNSYINGFTQGSKAMCKVIWDKACDEGKSLEEKIEDIKNFCKVSLGDIL